MREPLTTANVVTVLLPGLLTKSVLSSGLSTATLELEPGPLKGEPVIGDKSPLSPISKTSTRAAAEPLRATNRSVLAQLQSIPAAP